jgi:hypothetical protein
VIRVRQPLYFIVVGLDFIAEFGPFGPVLTSNPRFLEFSKFLFWLMFLGVLAGL